jgi:hypothetical protein
VPRFAHSLDFDFDFSFGQRRCIERGQAVGGVKELADAATPDFFAQQLFDSLRREQPGSLRLAGQAVGQFEIKLNQVV